MELAEFSAVVAGADGDDAGAGDGLQRGSHRATDRCVVDATYRDTLAAFFRAVHGQKIRRVAANLSHALSEYKHPFLEKRDQIKKVGIILVTSDKGLCGGLNTNVLRQLVNKMRELDSKNVKVQVTAIGSKGLAFLQRNGADLVSDVVGLGDNPHIETLIGPVKVQIDAFNAGEIDELKANGATVTRYPADKDATDTELAVHAALAAGATEITLLCTWGGRSDHAIGTLALLSHPSCSAATTMVPPTMKAALSTLTAIGGRMSAYTGREISWNWLLNSSKLSIFPQDPKAGPGIFGEVPIPGKVELL